MKYLSLSILLLLPVCLYSAEVPPKNLVVVNKLKENIRVAYTSKGTPPSQVITLIAASQSATLLPTDSAQLDIYIPSKKDWRGLPISPTDKEVAIIDKRIFALNDVKVAVISSDEEIKPCITQ